MIPTTLATLAAAAAALLPAAAVAAPRPVETPSGAMSYHRATDRYCLTPREATTGSRMLRTACKTASRWKAEGLTISRR